MSERPKPLDDCGNDECCRCTNIRNRELEHCDDCGGAFMERYRKSCNSPFYCGRTTCRNCRVEVRKELVNDYWCKACFAVFLDPPPAWFAAETQQTAEWIKEVKYEEK